MLSDSEFGFESGLLSDKGLLLKEIKPQIYNIKLFHCGVLIKKCVLNIVPMLLQQSRYSCGRSPTDFLSGQVGRLTLVPKR